MKKSEFDIKRNLLVMQLRNLDKQYLEDNCPFVVDDIFKYLEDTYQVSKVFVIRVADEKGFYTNEIAVSANRYRLGRSLNNKRVFMENDFKNMKKL